MKTSTFTVQVTINERGYGHAFVTSEAGDVGDCEVIIQPETVSGYADLGRIILNAIEVEG